jgi:peptidoglycan-N-acetylglucosamine deacetylase
MSVDRPWSVPQPKDKAMMRCLLVFSSAVLALAALPSTAVADDAVKRIALTFDDVPRAPGSLYTPEERTRRLITALEEGGVEQAAFFVTTGNLEQFAGGEERIGRYVAAGHVIANHSHRHPHLSEISAEDYLADIDRARSWLAGREGLRPWFRFPYLDEGREHVDKRDAVRAGLAERGLANGSVTVDGYDWFYDDAVTKAITEGRVIDMEALGELFVESHLGAAEFFDDLARRTFGRSPVHIMLLHEADVTATFLPDLISALEYSGWTIVPVDLAFADPIAAIQPDVPRAQGTLTELAAWESGLPPPRWYERNDERVVQALFDARALVPARASEEETE